MKTTGTDLAARRLVNQRLTGAGFRRPAEVVAWHGAVQAQEYEPAKWGLGLRLGDGASNADVEAAIEGGEILRTHVLRPTWHFVAREDIRWLLELTGPRVQQRLAPYDRRLELDAETKARGAAVLEHALAGGGCLTRAELAARLADAGLPMKTQRLAHLMAHAELEALICSGPRRGKQSTYVLLAERVPNRSRRSRDEALAELVRRFFQSHGPATVRDFVWWSGLLTADAKRGLEMIRARREDIAGKTYWSVGPAPAGGRREERVHLPPIYDEYIVAYRDRDAVPHAPPPPGASQRLLTIFQHTLLVDGQVAGTWKASPSSRAAAIEVLPLRRLTRPERGALAEAAERYARFQGVEIELDLTAESWP